MTKLAIIGGSGLTSMEGLEITHKTTCETSYGQPSAKLVHGHYAGKEIIFLPRHGDPHNIPPHRVNYRANLQALKDNGVTAILSINAVGGITHEMEPGRLVIPDQIIDYTWGRKHTFFEEELSHVTHVDFTHPFSANIRELIINTAQTLQLDVLPHATYGATQGPRLESAAEIKQMEQDGCDIVGMTGMPETALARELEINYASISIVVNWTAGKSDEEITMAMIEKNMNTALEKVYTLLSAVLPKI